MNVYNMKYKTEFSRAGLFQNKFTILIIAIILMKCETNVINKIQGEEGPRTRGVQISYSKVRNVVNCPNFNI